MRKFFLWGLVLFLGFWAFAETEYLGQAAFYNGEGKINMAVDASVVFQKMDSPYVMFMLFMGTDKDITATVHRDDVVLVYKDQEYKMSGRIQLYEDYRGVRSDINLYTRLGKEAVISSYLRFYRFQWSYDFFPVKGGRVKITDEGEMTSTVGFKTKAYFKNPGFQDGDKLKIKVRDKNDPEIWGSCEVELGKTLKK
jgi:hypothetical protein